MHIEKKTKALPLDQIRSSHKIVKVQIANRRFENSNERKKTLSNCLIKSQISKKKQVPIKLFEFLEQFMIGLATF